MSDMPRYTVDVKGARAAYEDLNDAQHKAEWLAEMNCDDEVTIEDADGRLLFTYRREFCSTCSGTGSSPLTITDHQLEKL
jgi:hypothetical protein